MKKKHDNTRIAIQMVALVSHGEVRFERIICLLCELRWGEFSLSPDRIVEHFCVR